jgi:hypothetical protein
MVNVWSMYGQCMVNVWSCMAIELILDIARNVRNPPAGGTVCL